MELRIASDRDLVNCYKSLQKLNEDCEKLRAQLKELEEAALPIARLLVPHPGGPKIAPLVDRLREAPSRLATYVKHLAKPIPNQVVVPRVVDVFAFKCLEAVGAWSGHLCNCEGTFPGRAEIVYSFRVLDATEDKITNVEGAFLDFAIMVASDTL
jgi:hypothetical protein